MTKDHGATFSVSLITRILTVLVSLIILLDCTIALGFTDKEQSTFSADPSEQVVRPVPVPDALLQVLAKDEIVAGCVANSPPERGRSLSSWFVASEIHLNESGDAGLVVLPIVEGEPYLCFHSAEGIGWFWVFRRIRGRYELLLMSSGLGLRILDTKHNGYRDIRVGSIADTTVYRFEGGRYQEYQNKAIKVH